MVPQDSPPAREDLTDLFGPDGLETRTTRTIVVPKGLPPKRPTTASTEVKEFARLDWSKPETFGETPLLFQTERAAPDLSPEFLPDWLRDFVSALAKETQTPEAMAIAFSLSALSVSLQLKYEVAPYEDGYSEPLNLWTVTVMPPGNRKSEVMKRVRAPLDEWAEQRLKALGPESDRVETEREVNAARIATLQKSASSETDAAKRQKQIDDINELKAQMPPQVVAPTLYATDVTPEALQNLLAENGGRGAVLADEGGLFEILSGLYSDGKANLDVFLSGHAGGPLRVKRSNRIVQLPKTAVSLGLGVQPQVIEDMAKKDRKSFRGKGLLARFLYFIPPSNVGQRDVRLRQPIPSSVRDRYKRNLKLMLDYEVGEKLITLTLSKEARDSYERFAQSIESRQGAGGPLHTIVDWTGKLPGAALRIAALCHIASMVESFSSEGAPLLMQSAIERDLIDRVFDFCEQLITHAQAAFDAMGDSTEIADAKVCLHWILANAERGDDNSWCFKRNGLHSTPRFKNSRIERLTRALEILQERRLISPLSTLPTKKPTKIHYVNPDLFVPGEA